MTQRRKPRVRALRARRVIDLVGLRVAPAATAALIVWSHTNYGKGLITFLAVLVAGQVLERARFPLSLMPAARIFVGLAAPVLGMGAAALAMLAMERTLSFGDMAAAVIGAWLVLALGAWIRYRVDGVASARIAVINLVFWVTVITSRACLPSFWPSKT